MYLTIPEAKNQCNIEQDFTEDDAYLKDLIETATVNVAKRCHIDDIKDFEDEDGRLTGDSLPLKRGIAFLVAQWYKTREPTVEGTITAIVAYTLDDILQDFINRTLA